MGYVVKRLALGVFLIVLASAILLISDGRHRRPSGKDAPGTSTSAPAQAALFQFSTRPLLDDAVAGVLDGLKERGFVSGRNMAIMRFDAENDMAAANGIAAAILGGPFRGWTFQKGPPRLRSYPGEGSPLPVPQGGEIS